MIVLARLEAVTDNAVDTTEASRFSKLATTTVSPVVWSEPAATAKLTAVMPPEAASVSVSEPVPPSIETSLP